MQISDLLGQYNRNVNQNVSIAAPTPGVQQLVETVREMAVGDVFEGTVNSVHRGDVVLGLSNGESITAHIAGKVQLEQGQSMFFQVKANTGSQVEIRPYTHGGLSNPTLLKALDAAGIPANDRMISMVNSMMEEQMPIDKQSLWNMTRVVSGAPDISASTLVQMSKLDIPITEQMASQFENYKLDQAAITTQMEAITDAFPDIFTGEGMTEQGALALNQQLLEILVPPEAQAAHQSAVEEMMQLTAEQNMNLEELADETVIQPELTDEAAELLDDTLTAQTQVKNQEDYPENTLGRELNAKQLGQLESQLREFSQLTENARLFVDGKLNAELDTADFLLELQQALGDTEVIGEASVKKLFGSKLYQSVLRNVLDQEWLVRPQDLQTEDKVTELYQKLERQMAGIEDVLRQTGQDASAFAKAAADVRGNVEFMAQINQTYQYVQIPLKLSGQNAHSDLYVYTNKKNLSDPDGELSAFLHLDLEHLGSTDVSVKMQRKKVQTDFYLSDDKSYRLVMENLEILQKRLQEKGYDCTLQAVNQEKKVDFVEDFLKKDQPASGRVHRYSFDVRA